MNTMCEETQEENTFKIKYHFNNNFDVVIEKNHVIMVPEFHLKLKLIAHDMSILQIPEDKNYPSYYVLLEMEFNYPTPADINNYIHKVRCKALLKNGNAKFHKLLSTEAKTKDKFHMSFENTFNLKVIHICIIVQRFKSYGAHDICKLLLDTGFDHTVSFSVKGNALQAHKHILSMKSEVFRVMFKQSMAENQKNIVEVNDFDLEVVKEMLSYIYTQRLGDLSSISCQLFKIAHKYSIHDLAWECEDYMLQNINLDNVIDICDLASLYELSDLREAAEIYVNKHVEDLIKTDSYQEYMIRNLKHNLTSSLKLSILHKEESLKLQIFDYVKEHSETMNDQEFLAFLDKYPKLAKDILIHIHRAKSCDDPTATETCSSKNVSLNN